MSKPVLYQFIFSCSAEKIRRALHQKGVEWDTVEVEWFDRKAVQQVSGQTFVPVLVHAGQTLGPTSIKVADYIEEAFPGKSLYPSNSWGVCHIIDDYVEQILMPLSLKAFLPHAGRVMNNEAFDKDVLRMSGCTREELDRDFGTTVKQYAQHWGYFDRHFATRKYFVGDELSMADHSLYSQYWFATNNPEFREKLEKQGLRHVDAWASRMKADYFTQLPF